MAKQNKPAIRFKGFTDAWEQRKLGELLKTITTGKSVNSDDGAVAVGDIGILKTSCVSYDRFNPYESKPVVKDELQSVKCAVEKDSVIVSRMNTPERVGACGYVSTDFPNLFLPDRLWKLKFQDNVDAYFVYMMLVSSVYKEKITSMASGTSGSMYNIPKETFLNLQLVVPVQTSEQRKIGQVLRQLNDLITLHQRKYDKLHVLKKAMLEKMFPKNGSSVPEIRFKGFTDAWEQRKLGEILQERNTRTSDFESNPLYSLTIESGVTPKTDRYERSSLVTKTEDLFKTVKPNEFVTNPMNLRFGALGYNKNAFTVSVSGYYDVFSIDDDKCSGFWNAYFKTPTAMNIFDNAATGSLIEKRRVKYSTLQQLAFYMPNDLSEKAEIGKYMDTFDHLITLHQRELEKLQNIKKSMLEKMFV